MYILSLGIFSFPRGLVPLIILFFSSVAEGREG